TNKQVTILTPGDNGAAKKQQFGPMIPDNGNWPGDCIGCPGGSVTYSGLSPLGTRYWLEAYLWFPSGYKWGCGGNCAMKTIGIHDAATLANRVLLAFWGSSNDSPVGSKGHLIVSMYPNYSPGGTDAGAQTNCCTEKSANVTEVPLVGGNVYHLVM